MTWYRQSMNWWWQMQSQNRHPHHDLPQAWVGKQTHVSILDVAQRKFAITPTYKYQDQWVPIQLIQIHGSKINKLIIGLWTWKIFYINQNNQLMLTIINTNRKTRHDLARSCRRRKYLCPVWICLTENSLSHPSTSISINDRLPDQCKQTSQQ